MPAQIIFVTGTDTGVGKTMLTSLLLCHLRRTGAHVLALKPFCSGSRADVQLLRSLQGSALSADEINPFFFPEPLAPLAAARLHRQSIPLAKVVHHIREIAGRCDCLLIEGVGGLLVPLGSRGGRGVPSATRRTGGGSTARGGHRALSGAYTVLDLIANLDCETIVVSRNQLGTINHTLLTIQALQIAFLGSPLTQRSVLRSVVLMNFRTPDPSSFSNPRILAELLAPIPLFSLPFLPGRHTAKTLTANSENLKSILLQVRCGSPSCALPTIVS
jgi:dethiobiotin synthetase